MLQKARVTAFTVSEVLRKSQHGVKLPPAAPRLELKVSFGETRNKNNIAETRITLEKPDPADKRVKDFCTYSCRQNFPNIAVQNFFFFFLKISKSTALLRTVPLRLIAQKLSY